MESKAVFVKFRSIAHARALQKVLMNKDYLWESGLGMLWYPWYDMQPVTWPICYIIRTDTKRVRFSVMNDALNRAEWYDNFDKSIL